MWCPHFTVKGAAVLGFQRTPHRLGSWGRGSQSELTAHSSPKPSVPWRSHAAQGWRSFSLAFAASMQASSFNPPDTETNPALFR